MHNLRDIVWFDVYADLKVLWDDGRILFKKMFRIVEKRGLFDSNRSSKTLA